jgi:hypothetical protein
MSGAIALLPVARCAIGRDLCRLGLRLKRARILEYRHELAVQMNHAPEWRHDRIGAGVPGWLNRRSIRAQSLNERGVIQRQSAPPLELAPHATSSSASGKNMMAHRKAFIRILRASSIAGHCTLCVAYRERAAGRKTDDPQQRPTERQELARILLFVAEHAAHHALGLIHHTARRIRRGATSAAQ